jgi:hypothetical protein
MDSLASVLAGISLFALIGNASYRSGHSIASISTRSDSGLAFVTVPEVLSQFGEYPGPQVVLLENFLNMQQVHNTYKSENAVFFSQFFSYADRSCNWKCNCFGGNCSDWDLRCFSEV